MTNKRSYKVVTSIDKTGGGHYWMRLGTAFTNRDDSINVYLDAMPMKNKDGCVIQLREMTEEDYRRRDDRPSSREQGPLGAGSLPLDIPHPALAADHSPF